MAIAYHWEALNLKHNEYGPIKPFSLSDENVVNNDNLETVLSKEAFSTTWFKVDGVEYKVLCAVQ